MRLDHLLSKEHWPPDSFWWSRAAPRSRWPVNLDGLHASGVVLEGGTLTSSAGSCGCPQYGPVSLRRRGAWNGVAAGDRFVGTLLGPEGAGDRTLVSGPVCIAYHQWVPAGVLGRRGGGTGVWSYVENCTVDASIF